MRKLFGIIAMLAASASAHAQTSFAVASIRPSAQAVQFEHDGSTEMTPMALHMRDVTIETCIKWAYGVQRAQVIGPDGMAQTHYDIEAKTEEPADPAKMKRMMQALLAERFKLVFHRETKEMRRYTLVVLPTGSKMKPGNPDGEPYHQNSSVGMVAKSMPMKVFADYLGSVVDPPVVDKTGLAGKYDFSIDFTRYVPEQQGTERLDAGSIMNLALQGELGLKLEPGRGPVEVLKIDHVEPPSEN